MDNVGLNKQGIQYGKIVDAIEGHELILQSLAANDVDYLFFCGGTDNYMFMESAKKFESLGRPHPKLLTCLHESAAVYAAYGYFMVSGKPQAVMLHVDNGTLNAGGSWSNSKLGNAGIVVLAGRTPWTTYGELPGSRNHMINYMQETYDQGSIIRQYVKWDFELRTIQNAGLVMQRAFRIASSEPYGPVYLTLPRELMLEKLPDGKGVVYNRGDFAASISPTGDIDALRETAKLLAEAERPVVSVKRMGRNPGAVGILLALCEKMAIPVISDDVFMNFPYDHPLRIFSAREYIEKADVLLLVDQDVPWMPSIYNPPRNCKVISLDIDPIRLAQPTWDYPINIPIVCDSSKALRLINAYVDEYITDNRKTIYESRRKEFEKIALTNSIKQKVEIKKAKGAGTISPLWLGTCINEIVDEKTIVVQGLARGITPGTDTNPGHYFGHPASSLGWALPAGIGAKLAAPESTVMSASGDGGFIFANPEACLWTMRKYNIPTLNIICNNRRYHAVTEPLRETYPGGYCVTCADFIGADLNPPVDFKLVAQSCGAYGEKVVAPAELPGALKRGLEAVHSGQAAVIDVIID